MPSRFACCVLVACLLPAVARGGAPLVETEPNDDFAGANAVAPGFMPAVAIEATLGPDATSSGVDYFSFPVASVPTLLTASVFDYTPDAPIDNDSWLGVFHPAGFLFDVADDGNPGLLSSLHMFPSQAGSWAAAVTGLGDAFFDGTGHAQEFDYRLVISTGASVFDADGLAANDTLATAQQIPASVMPAGSVSIEGSLAQDTTADGIDFYALDVAAGTLVTASVFDFTPEVSNDTASLLGVFAPDGSLLATDDIDGPGLLSAIHFFAPTSGTYTLALTGFNDSDFDGVGHNYSFDYRLVISVPEPTSLTTLLGATLLAGLGRRRRR